MMQSTPSVRENTEKRVHNRILITEDDPVIAKQTAEHLKSWGCEVCCTEDFIKIKKGLGYMIPEKDESEEK
jgi:hypothetical protein